MSDNSLRGCLVSSSKERQTSGENPTEGVMSGVLHSLKRIYSSPFFP